ncbi:MAG: hypothetical protein DWQ29_15725 [Planctomycetota bacterium]|nr:MAG: hypothetical protein DWQ29_15725 [Planctomycetota bacterium]
MKGNTLCGVVAAALLALSASASHAADAYGLEKGTPELQSASVLAFGPDGILFIGDTKAARIVAVQTGEKSGDPDKVSVAIDGLNVKIAELLGADSGSVEIADLAVSPLSGAIFVSVSGPDGPALVRISPDGELSEFAMQDVPYSSVDLPSPPPDEVVGEGRRRRNQRSDAITDLAFAEGQLLVSGLSTRGSPSHVWSFAFPFAEDNAGASLEIYHGAHGREEDYAAMRTFVPFIVDGEPNLLAGFVCTPLVRFPLSEIETGEIRGTTVAELGNRNRPLDMIAYRKDGEDYLLMINSNPERGTMKISTADLAENAGINERVEGGGTAGQPFEKIEELAGAIQLDRLGEEHAVVIIQNEGGDTTLKTIELP